MICVSPAAHTTFCCFKLFTSYILNACKQRREELVAFYVAAESAGASRLLLLKRRKKNFPSVFCLPLYCSKTSPSRPVTPPHPSSPLLLPILCFYPLWSSHLTALRFLQSSCREAQDLKLSSVRATAGCWLPSSPLLSLLIDSPAFAICSLSLPLSLPLSPPASNSQSSAISVCMYRGKK